MSQVSSMQYDLFIVYAPSDQGWVEGYLLPGLNLPEKRVRCTANFTPGTPLAEEYENAVTRSRYTLLILSPAYLADTWSGFGALLSTTLSIEEQERRVIPLYLKPCQPGLSISYLVSLDCTEPEQWPTALGRLHALLNQPVVLPAKIACPYPGMSAFREDDSDHFYGRDAEIKELVECLRLYPFLAIIGPSGSGKSSLAQAGLLPVLRQSSWFGRGDWLALVVRPSVTPYTNLRNAVDAYFDLATGQRRSESNQRICLIIDQFEEVFSLNGTHRRTALAENSTDDQASTEVNAFFQSLLRLLKLPNLYIVLTMRDDFYGKMMGSVLRDEFKAHHVDIPPLQGDGLRQAIVLPAQAVGVYIEDALVERLLAESSDQPGALPFIQETLVLLWERLERRYLPVRAYEDLVSARDKTNNPNSRNLSGIQVAMARRADAALAELTTPTDKLIAQRIFMRLIQFGEGRADTRRQQTVDELNASDDSRTEVERVIAYFVQCRLLTASGDQRIDMAHEKLIEGWPTLQGWIKELKAAEQVRRRLEAKAAEYQHLDGKGGLLDQVELTEAEEWLKTPAANALGCSERLLGFVKASKLAINPGWHRRGTVGLIGGVLGGIALISLLYVFINTQWTKSAANITTAFFVFIFGTLAIFTINLWRRANPYLLQQLSQTTAKQPVMRTVVIILPILAASLWGWFGSQQIALENRCVNKLGFTQNEPTKKYIALTTTQGTSSGADEVFKMIFLKYTEKPVYVQLVSQQDATDCGNFYDYSINLHEAKAKAQQEAVFIAEIKDQTIKQQLPPEQVGGQGFCGYYGTLAGQVLVQLKLAQFVQSDDKDVLQGPRTCMAYIHFQKGAEFLSEEDYRNAEAEFLAAISYEETYAQAHGDLGYVYYITGRFKPAIAQLEIAIKQTAGKYPDFLTHLAYACYLAKQYECAETNAQKAIEVNKSHFNGYNLLSVIYRSQQKYDLAEAMLNQAEVTLSQVKDQTTRETYEVALYKNRGILALKRGLYEDARTWLRQAFNYRSARYEGEIIFYLINIAAHEDSAKACKTWKTYLKIEDHGLPVEIKERQIQVQQQLQNLHCPTE